MSWLKHVVACLCLAFFIMLVRAGYTETLEALHIPPPQGCVRHREIRYCVTTWNRDSWNVNARAAIGDAAAAWNRAGPYRFREVYCNAPHDLPIFFEHGEHADGHASSPWPEHVLAHATFPSADDQYIHIDDDYAWWQALDTPGQGYDLRAVALHEMGHSLGLAHDEGDSTMPALVVPWGGPYENDIELLRSYAKRCAIEPPPALEITEPSPGTTWRQGHTYPIAWNASALEGHVQVTIYHLGEPWWIAWQQAPVSGHLEVNVHGGWPVGPGYEVCLWHESAGQFCSNMTLVAP